MRRAAERGVSDPIERGLDGLNFFLADVRDGLGPYLSGPTMDAASIGVVISIAAISAMAPRLKVRLTSARSALGASDAPLLSTRHPPW